MVSQSGRLDAMRARFVIGLVTAIAMLAIAVSERPAYSHKPITTTIIFNKEIAQIFQRKCFSCHSENNLAMSLTTYEMARPWARAIREEVVGRRMPPWGAVTGFGHFANDLSLTPREMDIILSWADGGAPSGVLKAEESTPPVYVPSAPVWDAGQPDEVLSLDKPVTMEPGSGNQVQRIEVTAQFSAPRSVRGIAFKPGDRRVVRYATVYEVASNRWLWTWTPWHTSMNLPQGVVYKLPARARLRVEIGYRAIGEPVSDKSELGLYFSDAAAAQDAAPLVIAPSTTAAMKQDGDVQKLRGEAVVTAPRRALAIWPELPDGAKSLEVSAVAPDGVTEPLLWVKDVRANWPTSYVLRAPIAMAKGTKLVMTMYLDGAAAKSTTGPRVTVITTATN
jgi:hypothetical protein